MYIISLALFIDFLGFGLILPLTPIFQETYHLSLFQIGLFTSVFFLFNLFGNIIMGPLSDKIGRKPILLFSTLGLSITYIINAVIQLDEVYNTFNIMLILRALIGFFSGNIPIIFACSVDISTTIESRRKDMAILGAVIGLGFILGPTIGGLFAYFTTTKTIAPFYFSGIISAICFILLLFIFKETCPKSPNNSTKELENENKINYSKSSLNQTALNKFTTSSFIIPLLLFVGFFFSFAGFEVYLISDTLGNQLKLSQLFIGIFWASFALLNSVFQFILIKFVKLRTALILGFSIYACGMLSYVFTSFSIWALCVSMVICSIGIAFILPNISTLISLKGSKYQQGLIFSITQSFGAIGRALGPFVLGGFVTIFNTINVIWIFMFILMIIQAILVIRFIPKEINNN